jgi:hypothetical protein
LEKVFSYLVLWFWIGNKVRWAGCTFEEVTKKTKCQKIVDRRQNPLKVLYFIIIYINSVSLSVCPSVEVLKFRSLLIKLSPWTRGPKNYSGPWVFTSYFYFYVRFRVAIVECLYFLLLFLRPFSRSNCQRSLLLTFIFTSVFA